MPLARNKPYCHGPDGTREELRISFLLTLEMNQKELLQGWQQQPFEPQRSTPRWPRQGSSRTFLLSATPPSPCCLQVTRCCSWCAAWQRCRTRMNPAATPNTMPFSCCVYGACPQLKAWLGASRLDCPQRSNYGAMYSSHQGTFLVGRLSSTKCPQALWRCCKAMRLSRRCGLRRFDCGSTVCWSLWPCAWTSTTCRLKTSTTASSGRAWGVRSAARWRAAAAPAG